jgi:hypothetical protein
VSRIHEDRFPPIAPPTGLAHEESPGGNVPRLGAHPFFGAAQGNLPAGTRKALNAVPAGKDIETTNGTNHTNRQDSRTNRIRVISAIRGSKALLLRPKSLP